MRILLLFCSVALLAAAQTDNPQVQDFDHPVCYVNAAVITRSDVRERMQEQLYVLRSRGRMPRTAEALKELEQRMLEDLIDEELLVQQADAMQVSIDMRRLRREVVQQANERGMGNDMLTITTIVERRMRNTKLQQVLGFFEQTVPAVGPEEVAAFYKEHSRRFQRPGRVRLRQILLAVSGDEQLESLRKRLLAMVRSLRAHASRPVQKLVQADLIDAVVEAEPAQQVQLLLDLMRAIRSSQVAAQDAPALYAEAEVLLAESVRLRSKDAALMQADFLRGMTCAAPWRTGRSVAFAHLAEQYSDGVQSFGDLGWMEATSLSPVQKEALDGLSLGMVSQPFWQGNSCALIFVDDIQPPRQRRLAEVSAEIESLLNKQQRQDVRETVLKRLRDEAQITFPES